jgi:hypothetical protein
MKLNLHSIIRLYGVLLGYVQDKFSWRGKGESKGKVVTVLFLS